MKILLLFLLAVVTEAATTIIHVTQVEALPNGDIAIHAAVSSTSRQVREVGSIRVEVTESQALTTFGSDRTAMDLVAIFLASRKAQFSRYFQSGDNVIVLGPQIGIRVIQ
jgi:hypothetical protein